MLTKDQAAAVPRRVRSARGGGGGGGGSLTPEQVAFYDREGYLVLDRHLGAEELEGVKGAMRQKVDGIADALYEAGEIADKHADAPFERRLAMLFAGKSDAEFLKYGRSWRDRLPGYFELMTTPKILDAVESLIGGEIFSNPVYNVRPKVPGVAAGAVPWHQDRSYWPDANANPVITAWIPVVDATEVNGCLHVWPRTHRTRMYDHEAEGYSGTAYTTIPERHLRTLKREAVALPVAAGSIILFNDRNVHMSTANRSDHVRWSVDLRYQPTDQDPMPQHGAGFLARSRHRPERVATLSDWLAGRPERAG